MPGEGVEPSRPALGAADFKSAAYRQFRHPGAAEDTRASARLRPRRQGVQRVALRALAAERIAEGGERLLVIRAADREMTLAEPA